MTTYTADGDLGAMTSQEGELVGAHGGDTHSANILDADNDIPLTGLTFDEISWSFRVSTTFEDRTLMHADLSQIQYDSDIDGYLGSYARGSKWFTRQEGVDEGLEVHGGVDGAWWQLLFVGLGRAIFTNGQQSQEVSLVSGDFYVVSMSFNTSTGYATTQLTDRFGVLVANLIASGLSIPLTESNLGASGTTFNFQGEEIPADIAFYEERNYVIVIAYGDGEQFSGEFVEYTDDYVEGYYSLHTGECGTTSGKDYWPHTSRPWWSGCTKLDNTIANWATAETWYRLRALTVPDGYQYLHMRSKVKNPTFNGKVAMMYARSGGWPTYLFDGTGVGDSGYMATGEEYIIESYIPIAGRMPGDDDPSQGPPYGILPTEASFYVSHSPATVAVIDAYDCAFDWPYGTGVYGSWRCEPVGLSGPFGWSEFFWVPYIDTGEELKVEVDDIWFGAVTGTPGEEMIEDVYEVSEGWNTEMVEVEGGVATIRATPVQGTVNIFDAEGELLDYVDDWEEADDLGLRYTIKTDDTIVTITYFVTRPTFDSSLEAISRSSLLEFAQNVVRAPLVHGP